MIEPPTHCPACDSTPLEWVKDQLYCRNPDCSAVSAKRVEHFASTMKIKGLGPSTISKLGFTSIADIYNCSLEYVIGATSEKVGPKLWAEIEQSKLQPLNVSLAAFSIPLIGKTAADKLGKVCYTLADITAESCKQAGLGEKATANLLTWLGTNVDLPLNWTFSTPSASRGIVCITGKLKSFPNKQAAAEALQANGFIVKDSLTKDVTILVNESGKVTAKTQKALDSGITPVYDLIQFLGEF